MNPPPPKLLNQICIDLKNDPNGSEINGFPLKNGNTGLGSSTVLVLDQKVLGTWQVIFKYYLLKSVKVANYLNTLL